VISERNAIGSISRTRSGGFRSAVPAARAQALAEAGDDLRAVLAYRDFALEVVRHTYKHAGFTVLPR
jgi:hypothetical protein